MKKLYLLTATVFICFTNLNAQTFLNGGFETTTSTGCDYNLTNSVFNAKMSYVNAFGTPGEVDIQRLNCNIPSIPEGNVAVSLNARVNSGGTDAVALTLSSSLTTGISYRITFKAFGNNAFSPGLATLNIGCSTTNNNSSSPTIYTPVLVANQWTSYSFDFIAPNAGKFITVIPENNSSSVGKWTTIDDFKITLTSLATNEQQITKSIRIYPNPVQDFLKVVGLSSSLNYSIVNAAGQKVGTGVITENEKIEVKKLSKGLYFLLFENGTKIKFIKE